MMTPKQRAWLQHLADHGPDKCAPLSKAGWHCHRAGWTEWFVTLKDGRSMPLSEAYGDFPLLTLSQVWDEIKLIEKECITALGRAALTSASKVASYTPNKPVTP